MKKKFELNIYDRIFFENQFDANKCNIQIFSLFYLLFFDDFEFYRNNYKSFINVYVILVVFNFNERMRRVNVFFLIFESHESNFNNVLNILLSLHELNKKSMILNLS